MSPAVFLYLVNVFMFSICFGLYTTMMLHRWRRMRALHRSQYMVVDSLLAFLMYAFAEAAITHAPVEPRHYVSFFVAISFFAVQLWTLYDEAK